MAMNRIIIACIAAFLVCSLLCQTPSATPLPNENDGSRRLMGAEEAEENGGIHTTMKKVNMVEGVSDTYDRVDP
ncbi:hypothetical protein ACHQM5_009666 [Ranunculus cassubicifolius]